MRADGGRALALAGMYLYAINHWVHYADHDYSKHAVMLPSTHAYQHCYAAQDTGPNLQCMFATLQTTRLFSVSFTAAG